MKTVLLKNLLSLTVSLVIALSAVGQATAADSQYRRNEAANPLLVRPGSGGRLVIWRIANLGKGAAVCMWLDGMPIGVIGYGHTYDRFLPAGHHVLSVTVSPHPTWPGYESQTILNVRNGQTYAFTAEGDHSGHLILKSAAETANPYLPNGYGYAGRAVSY
jgi:hypothetical protein